MGRIHVFAEVLLHLFCLHLQRLHSFFVGIRWVIFQGVFFAWDSNFCITPTLVGVMKKIDVFRKNLQSVRHFLQIVIMFQISTDVGSNVEGFFQISPNLRATFHTRIVSTRRVRRRRFTATSKSNYAYKAIYAQSTT